MFKACGRLAFLVIFLISQGCGNAGSPVDTIFSPEPNAVQNSGGTKAQNNTVLWGMWEVVIDPITFLPEITALRSSQYAFNVTEFLQPPTTNTECLGISVTDADEFSSSGRLTIDVSLRNPFKSARLKGFDTFGVFIHNGDENLQSDPSARFAGWNSSICAVMENADGYTRWMNPVEFTDSGLLGFSKGKLGSPSINFTATINPYKYFAHTIQHKQPAWHYLNAPNNIERRGVFFEDTVNTREYVIRFPIKSGQPEIRFQYAVISHWKNPVDSQGKPIQNPKVDDFSIDANCAEPVAIRINSKYSYLYYKNSSDFGDTLVLDLQLYDWQGTINPNGVIDEIDHIVIDSSDGLFGGLPWIIYSSELQQSVIASTPNSVTVRVEKGGCLPKFSGDHDLFLSVLSKNPTSYDQGFGTDIPQNAKLANYFRFRLPIPESPPNVPPKITKILGQTIVNCLYDSEEYIVFISDPNGDPITYKWELTSEGVNPDFTNPISTQQNCVIDWSNDALYPLGLYNLWVRVNDGVNEPIDGNILIEKSSAQLLAQAPSALPEFCEDVPCGITGTYTSNGLDCNPDAELEYRFIRKLTTDSNPPDSSDPEWTSWSDENFYNFTWNSTDPGEWRVWSHVREKLDNSVEDYSFPLSVFRINSPHDVGTPSGPVSASCSDILEYTFVFNDCDAEFSGTKEYYLSFSPTGQVGGAWIEVSGTSFLIDFSSVDVKTWYLYTRAIDSNYSIYCPAPLVIQKLNTPPDIPDAPEGPQIVNCTENGKVYDVGNVSDCDLTQQLSRQYAISDSAIPPTTGWFQFSGTQIQLDWEPYPPGLYYLFQRVNDGINQSYSAPLMIEVLNSGPLVGDISGPVAVFCDSYEEYTVDIFECDPEDALLVEWYLSSDKFTPTNGVWTPAVWEKFHVSYKNVPDGIWYLFVKVSDGIDEDISDEGFEVVKLNTPSQPPLKPVGPETVSCGDIATYYFGDVQDCDVGDIFLRGWYVTDGAPPIIWTTLPDGINYVAIDWSNYADGQFHYLWQFSDDGSGILLSEPLQIWKKSEAPENAIFVAPSVSGGSDLNSGSKTSPVASLSYAYSLAIFHGFNTIIVANGNYISLQTIELKDGFNLWGGWDYSGSGCWTHNPLGYSVFNGPATAASAENFVQDTTIKQLSFRAGASFVPGGNSTAVYIKNCGDNLRFEQCRFFADGGASGQNGTPGINGVNGLNGGDGFNGCLTGGGACGTCTQPSLGLGGLNICLGNMTHGGNGGVSGLGIDGFGGNGQNGDGSFGGIGGNGGAPGLNGDSGQNGNDGVKGNNGTGGDSFGSIINGIWVGSNGADGVDGTYGSGGGAGGGGGGWSMTETPFCDFYGGSGGGGGAGGCAGTAGTGGTSGGGSFGVFLFDSSPVFLNCLVSAGTGGKGGDGGAGGIGGSGGGGGNGGLGIAGSGNGGNGGDGGRGGDGGNGGGGSGGISYCIYRAGNSDPLLTDIAYIIGSAGSGGFPNGENGIAGDLF